MEEIQKRLREATDACLAAHLEWAANIKNGPAREKLMEAVHELRKVAARLEIEMAISERDEMAAKPIPIPPHRASKRRPGELNELPSDEDAGNGNGSDQGHDNGIARTMRRRRPHGGGHGGGGGHGNHGNQGGNGPSLGGGGPNGNIGNRSE